MSRPLLKFGGGRNVAVTPDGLGLVSSPDRRTFLAVEGQGGLVTGIAQGRRGRGEPFTSLTTRAEEPSPPEPVKQSR